MVTVTVQHLHSTMDRLETYSISNITYTQLDLHSTMDRLET